MNRSPSREAVLSGVTYWSSELGPFLWHEFVAERVRADLRAMAAAGLRAVRALLPWDVFVPTRNRVDPAALRDFEILLAGAVAASMAVIPVMFAQTIGDCVMLPAYAIDVAAKRPAVRAVTGGVVQPGGPRDQYTDASLLESEVVWLDTMLAEFAGHPAILSWDLGHDPATVMRPRRVDDMARWVALMAARVHSRQERCGLTLGSRDVTTARAVRPGAIAPALDAIGLEVDPHELAFAAGGLDPRPVAFVVQLLLRLTNAAAPVHGHISAPSRDGDQETADTVPPNAIGRFAAGAADALTEAGCAGLFASVWSDCRDRVLTVPPFDRRPELGRRGLVDTSGDVTAFGAAWLAQLTDERDREPPSPWPDAIDVDSYYANLPESVNDLYAAWERGASGGPGMLG